MRNLLLCILILISPGLLSRDSNEDRAEIEDLRKRIERLENQNSDSGKERKRSESESTGYSSPMKGNLPKDFLKNLQLIPEHKKRVTEGNSLWISENWKLGFQLRPRLESIYNPLFYKYSKDMEKTYVSQNSQFYAIGDISPSLAFKITFQDTRIWGGSELSSGLSDGRYGLSTGAGQIYTSGSGTEIPVRNSLDLREAFVLIKQPIPGLSVRIGRQILSYGDGRILGSRNFNQTGNSLDGVRIVWKNSYLSSHALGFVLSDKYNSGAILSSNSTNSSNSNQAYLGGIYNTIHVSDLFSIDLYELIRSKKYIENSNSALYDTQNRLRQWDHLYTSGIRITNRTDSKVVKSDLFLDWTLEAAFQTGFTGDRIPAGWDSWKQEIQGKPLYTERVKYDSGMAAFQSGLTFFGKFRTGIQYLQASGDPNRSDSRDSTWNPLLSIRRGAGEFPGFSAGNLGSLYSWRNIKSYSFHNSFQDSRFGKFYFIYTETYKFKEQDGWYNSGGSLNGNASTENFSNTRYGTSYTGGKRLMTEYDFIYQKMIYDNLSLWAGMAFVYAGDSIRKVRNNPSNTDPLQRYTLKSLSNYFFFQIQFAI